MKKCLKCHQMKSLKQFSKTKRRTDGYQNWCKPCIKQYDADRFRAVRPHRYQQIKARQREMLEWFRLLKNEPCMDCHQQFHPICMDFDHRDRVTKAHNLADLVRRGCGKKTILREIAKCDLVCANCHRIREYQRGLV